MSIPFLYAPNIPGTAGPYELDETASRHLQVLRGKPGDPVTFTAGRGNRYDAVVTGAGKRNYTVRIGEVSFVPPPTPQLDIAISFTKNISRIEWFLEKATEIGISCFTPLLCRRSERAAYNAVRLQKVLVSAMLQSGQCHLPVLQEQLPLPETLREAGSCPQRFIAHCGAGPRPYLAGMLQAGRDATVLIGPEGDFTAEEVAAAEQAGYLPVSLGTTRLRTETAGVVAATLLKAVNER
jgi:16S rRNA (uracil1498-N3)-methyltransferase